MILKVATEVAYALGGSALALGLLSYLHGGWQPGWALICGVLGAVLLRRLVGQTYAALPPFIRRPLDAGVATGTVFLAVWATLVRYPFPYWLLKWREATSLPSAAALLGLGIAAVVYTHRRLQREIEAREARMAALREAELRARLRALQAQINPHFLFNSLNSLAELVHGDPDEAEQMVGDLAHLLRYSLRSSAAGLVPLSQEITAVERYLRLERARFGDRIHIEFDVQADALAVPVPGLVLQPLVENAVKYAVAPRPEGGHIRVTAALAGDELRLEVEDDGPGLDAGLPARTEDVGTGGAGGGLANARQRLALSYREGGVMEVEPGDRGGTRIVLHVPCTVSQEDEP
jgi:sensor histidine kinase YesM